MKHQKKLLSLWLDISKFIIICFAISGCNSHSTTPRVRCLHHLLCETMDMRPRFMAPADSNTIIVLDKNSIHLFDKSFSNHVKLADLPVVTHFWQRTDAAIREDYFYCVDKNRKTVIRCHIKTGQVDTIYRPSLEFMNISEVCGELFAVVKDGDFFCSDRYLYKLDFNTSETVLLKAFSKEESSKSPQCVRLGDSLALVINNKVITWNSNGDKDIVLPDNDRVEYIHQFSDGSKILIVHLWDVESKKGYPVTRIYRISKSSDELTQTFEYSYGFLNDAFADGDNVIVEFQYWPRYGKRLTYFSSDKGDNWTAMNTNDHSISPGYLQDGLLKVAY